MKVLVLLASSIHFSYICDDVIVFVFVFDFVLVFVIVIVMVKPRTGMKICPKLGIKANFEMYIDEK